MFISDQFPLTVCPLCYPPPLEWLDRHSMLPLFSSSIDVELVESVDDWELNRISLSTDSLSPLLQAWITCLGNKDFVVHLRRYETDFLKSCPGFLILDGNHRDYVRQFYLILLFGNI
jgi:hypothetical protein